MSRRNLITAAPAEWDSKLPKFFRRLFWKGERQARKSELPERLVDDYTRREFMADICTPEEPCELCVRHKNEPAGKG